MIKKSEGCVQRLFFESLEEFYQIILKQIIFAQKSPYVLLVINRFSKYCWYNTDCNDGGEAPKDPYKGILTRP